MDDNERRIKTVDEATAYVREFMLERTDFLATIVAAVGLKPSDEGYQEKLDALVLEFYRSASLIVAQHTLDIEEDRIEGLEEDLYQAVQVAYNRGAEKWALLNYPDWKSRLEAGKKFWEEGQA